MNICVVVEALTMSGGSLVILRHVEHLTELGHTLTLALPRSRNAGERDWHPALQKLNITTIEEAAKEPYDLAIATWWRTVYDLPKFRARQYAYFLQDIECLFYPPRDPLKAFAEKTYSYRLPGITISNWSRDRLAEHFGMKLALVPNGMDKATFRPDGPRVAPREPGRLRVVIEGAFGAPRKNTARAIELASRSGAHEIWLLTPTKVAEYPHIDRIFSRVTSAQCAEIYRSCDVLLKLSSVECCPLPYLEMFHCGGTLVTFDIPGPSNFVRHRMNSLVAPLGDEAAVVAHLKAMKESPALVERLRQGALETAARWPDWPAACAQFADRVEQLLDEPVVLADTLAAIRSDATAVEAALRERPRGARAFVKSLSWRVRGRVPALNNLATIYRARHVESRGLHLPDPSDAAKYYRPSILALSAEHAGA